MLSLTHTQWPVPRNAVTASRTTKATLRYTAAATKFLLCVGYIAEQF